MSPTIAGIKSFTKARMSALINQIRFLNMAVPFNATGGNGGGLRPDETGALAFAGSQSGSF
jgi:hypothetical protein